jgi:hypothetical protein
MPPGAQRIVDELTLDALTLHATTTASEGEGSAARRVEHARERMLAGDGSSAPIAAGGRDSALQQQSLASVFASFAVASASVTAGAPDAPTMAVAQGAATIVAPRRTSDSGAGRRSAAQRCFAWH